MAMERTVTSHSLFCLQGAKNCSYVTCYWTMLLDGYRLLTSHWETGGL